MGLINLIYVSRNSLDLEDADVIDQLNRILGEAIAWNAPRYVTGALLFDQEHFIQALEGERDDVWATFKRIEKDPRHHDIELLGLECIAEREFGSWWMRCGIRTPANAAVFDAYARGGVFNPRRLTAPEILSLMNDLARPIASVAAHGYSDHRLIATDSHLHRADHAAG